MNQPLQGWKLHVSSTVDLAETVLGRALPVLASSAADFKVVSSAHALESLNRGESGITQVGKFITVYPDSDDDAVAIAEHLDALTSDLVGPAIPSDRPLRRASLVHYRYGAFSLMPFQTAVGEVVPGIRDSNGQLVPDDRRRRPPLNSGPFPVVPEIEVIAELDRRLRASYHIVRRLQWSPRASVHLAVDLRQLRSCIVKSVRSGDHGGLVRLSREAAVLRALAGTGVAPDLFDEFVTHSSAALVMEDLGGLNMGEWLNARKRLGQLPSDGELRATGRELARLLEPLHTRGLVYRDLKPPNIMLADGVPSRLVDFELVCEAGDPEVPIPAGTEGYMPQAQSSPGRPPALSDDIYALGACLYHCATGADPMLAPDNSDLFQRPVRALNPWISLSTEDLIRRCLSPEPENRPMLSQIASDLERRPSPRFAEAPVVDAATHLDSERLARALADALCRSAERDGDGLTWASAHPTSLGLHHRFINIGVAGCVLALAEAVRAFDRARHREVLAHAARWLLDSQPFAGETVPGLYVGEAGVGLALLRAGEILGATDLVDAAARVSDEVAALGGGSPDLFNGWAGRLRFHLMVHAVVGGDRHRRHAEAVGRLLLDSVEDTGSGGVAWRIPEGYGSLSGQRQCGYAHGAAGIADSLIDLYRVTGDERIAQTITAAARWLAQEARPALRDGNGVEWPSAGEGSGGVWCHGAAGVGRFLLDLDRVGLSTDRGLLEAAARMVARGARWLGPAYCHGLAGNIDFLLDVHHHTGDPVYLEEASGLVAMLRTFAVQEQRTTVIWSDTSGCVTPDFMVGYSGALVALIRYTSPTYVPSPLTFELDQQQPHRDLNKLDVDR